MPHPNLDDPFEVRRDLTFVNWHETVQQGVHKRIVARNPNPGNSTVVGYTDTTTRLQDVISEGLNGKLEVRALGSAWSFSDVASTKGILIDTWPLNYRFGVSASQKHPACPISHLNLHFVQCGCAIASLSKYLYKLNQSLQTTGASNGQTIAGALATGAHGSAIDVGSIQDSIRAIHLITSPTKSVWLERETAPTVTNEFARKFADDVRRNDELFNAALVSFGSFGIIHGVVIESTDLFYLYSSKYRLALDSPEMRKAITTLDTSGLNITRPFPGRRPYHFKLVIDPNNRTEVVTEVIFKYLPGEPPPPCLEPATTSGSGQSDEAFAVLATITDVLGPLTKDLISKLFETFYKLKTGVCGTLGESFTDTTTRGKAFSSAMGIPLNRVEEALEVVFREYDKDWAPVIVALRFVKESKATLAFTTFAPYTCVLEIDGPVSQRVESLASRVWAALDQAGIPYTFHWGKCNNLNAATVRQKFGVVSVNSWLQARRNLLGTAELQAVFANDFTRKLNLHT